MGPGRIQVWVPLTIKIETGCQCPDRMAIFSRRHLEAVVHVYVEHYNRHRPHRGLDLSAPDPTSRVPSTTGAVIRQPLLSGLVNEYQRRAA